MRTTSEIHGKLFFIKLGNKWFMTPLFVVLIMIEVFDVVFALDSIPAAFDITHDPFIIYTSNIFAILGILFLYFLLANALQNFIYLKTALSIIFIYVGIKMLIGNFYDISAGISLFLILIILSSSICLSILKNSKKL